MQYAEKLDDTYCAGCHAPIAATITPSMRGRPLPKEWGHEPHERKRTGHFNAVFPVQRQRYTEKQ